MRTDTVHECFSEGLTDERHNKGEGRATLAIEKRKIWISLLTECRIENVGLNSFQFHESKEHRQRAGGRQIGADRVYRRADVYIPTSEALARRSGSEGLLV